MGQFQLILFWIAHKNKILGKYELELLCNPYFGRFNNLRKKAFSYTYIEYISWWEITYDDCRWEAKKKIFQFILGEENNIVFFVQQTKEGVFDRISNIWYIGRVNQ